MKRRRFFAVALVLTVVVVWKLFFAESVYDGRSTSEWVTILESGNDADRQKAVAALQHIGTESVKKTHDLLAHRDEEVRLAAFDVLEDVLVQCNQNFEVMNCVTGYVPGRRRAARAIPPIAEAIMGCLFGGDEALRRRSESVIDTIEWNYAVIGRRATAQRLLDEICRGLASDDDKTRHQAAALFEAVLVGGVSPWQSDLQGPTAGRLLDIAVKQDPPSEPVMRSLLLCLVGCEKDPTFTKRVQALESHIIELLDDPPAPSEPETTGMTLTSQYDDPTVRYWAAAALLRYGTHNAIPSVCEALHDQRFHHAAASALSTFGDTEQCRR